MVRTNSSVAGHGAAGDPDANANAAACYNERYAPGHAEFVRLSSPSLSNAADANTAARISESRGEGRAGDH